MCRFFRGIVSVFCLSMLVTSSGVKAGEVERDQLAGALASMVLTISTSSGQAQNIPALAFLQELNKNNPQEFAALVTYFLSGCSGDIPAQLKELLGNANLLNADGTIKSEVTGSLALLKQIVADYNANKESMKQCCAYGCKKGCCGNCWVNCFAPWCQRNSVAFINFTVTTVIPLIESIILSKTKQTSAVRSVAPSLEDTLARLAAVELD